MNPQIDEMTDRPTRHFGAPGEVVDHPELSYADKRRILESWKHDAQRLSESTAENMSGGEESDLRSVSRALVQLKAMVPLPEAIQVSRGAPVGAGMTIGALLGAGAGLIATAATTTVSVALIAQTTAAGLVVGGVAGAIKGAVGRSEL